ncbi:hypothetical protein [Methylomicrobium sp. Wu6]|uniref:hypothetical protein n=1 Tax=Methylomicrobium sp. Wu6 TaxID=3107928 RepID=UPI002DD62A1A|nr:hypothetical protein [Methylomicrobium sp. Wu6]MEC4747149.1 hypothetical protein [Methylomicrobium sp. Wu6]
MSYVSCNDAGEITGLHRSPPGVETEVEWLESGDSEMHHFLQSCAVTEQAWRSLPIPIPT